jgi:protein associated with RNAse G/E
MKLLKKLKITETINFHTLCWFGHVHRNWKKTELSKEYYTVYDFGNKKIGW